MSVETKTSANVKLAVPFFMVKDMEASLRYYVDGLGYKMVNKWIDEGKLRWCWLEIGDTALMLQEYRPSHVPEGKLGTGVSLCFQCEDALAIYREFTSRGVKVQTPFVGNNMWVANVKDPDGYNLSFQSPTDVPEETVLSDLEK